MEHTTERIFENIPGAIIICQTGGERKITFASIGAARLFGFETVEQFLHYVGSSWQLLIYAEDEPSVMRAVWEQIETYRGYFFIIHRIILPDHSFRNVAQMGHLVTEPGKGDFFYIVLYDADVQRECNAIQERQRVENEMIQREGVDGETGFVKKRFFISKAEEKIREILNGGSATAFLHIYVNGQYMFANRYGKANEINLLQRIATLLRNEFPRKLIGRLETDRFSVVTTAEGAKKAIERVNDAIGAMYPDTGISIKAGCVIIENTGFDFNIAEVMEHAESACNSIALFDDICYSAFD